MLVARLRAALARLNPAVPAAALDEALRKLLRPDSPSLLVNNRVFHRMLIEGVNVEMRRPDGSIAGAQVRLVDFAQVAANDWLAVNQFTVIEGQRNRRADIVLFVNGLPLAVIELKNPADEDADVWKAFNQLQTYKAQIPSLFVFNEALVISDGLTARIGSLTADKERFMPWRTIAGEDLAPATMLELEVLLRGVFERGRIILEPAMENPTLVVITDRNDLDEQLFGTFARCQELLRQTPVQAADRADLRAQLQVASGGVVFTTIQKFLPEEPGDRYGQLSDRRNIVVIADEAHRSQYGFEAKLDAKGGALTYGFAQHVRDALPNASFIGFTGTPVELTDRNTRSVFCDYISIYDIQRAVADGATVPIYNESRLAKLALDEREKPHLDSAFEEVTEGEEAERKEQLKSKWAALEAIVGADTRIKLIAADLVEHFARRQEALAGKAMIVCMSRRICVDLYNALIALRPEWHSDDDGQGAIKVVMTGSASDKLEWQPHIRTKARREALAQRFKDLQDSLQLVIVRDMWLNGFDAPCLHTMYVDKPMRGHGLMQAIARVNRVFRDKPGGLIVDYLDHAIRQLVSRAIASDQVIDIFAAAGLQKPDLSILSDEFLAEVRSLPYKNVAVELLRKLLADEIKTRARSNVVQARSFAELLERSIRAYQNRAIETAQIIEELIALAKDMRAAVRRGEALGLTDAELAFYDALETNDSAVAVLGDETLRAIARELVETVRRNVTIDWTVKESARARLRTIVKRILRRYGYPPDKQEKAVQTVLEQAEVLGKDWVA